MSLRARAAVAWLVLFAVMFANGTARVLLLQPRLGEDRARQVASLTGLIVVLLVSWVFVRASPLATSRQLLWVGVGWLAGTLAFEFAFGHFVSGLGRREMLADYNVLEGRLWPIILVGTCFGPWFWGSMARRHG